MPIPPRPTADFIMIQAHFPLGRFKELCNGPAGPRHPHQLLERGRLGSKDDVSLQLMWGTHTPPDQQPATPVQLQGLGPGQPTPVIPPRTFRAIARTVPRPAVV